MLIRTFLFVISLSVISNGIQAMECDDEPEYNKKIQGSIQNLVQNEKKKRRKKRKKITNNKFVNIGSLNIADRFEKNKKTDDEYLTCLQSQMSMIYFHQQVLKALHSFKELCPQLEECQKYRETSDKRLIQIIEATDLKENENMVVSLDGKIIKYVYKPEVVSAMIHFKQRFNYKCVEKIDFTICNALLESNNQDVKELAGLAKHTFLCYQYVYWVKRFPSILGLVEMLKAGNSVEYENYFSSVHSEVRDFAKKWPHFIESFCALKDIINDYSSHGGDGDHGVLVTKNLKNIMQRIREIESKSFNYLKDYDDLYANSFKEMVDIQKTVFKKTGRTKDTYARLSNFKKVNSALLFTESFFASNKALFAKLHIKYNLLSDDLPASISFTEIFSDQKKEFEVGGLESEILQENIKNLKQENACVKNIIKSGQLKEFDISGFEPEDTPKFLTPDIDIAYDQRVLNWFDDGHNSNKTRGAVTYHSFSLLADKYIFSLANPCSFNNRTRDNQNDYAYSLRGEMHFDDDKKEYVQFMCTKGGIDGMCYHRGFKKLTAKKVLEELDTDWNAFYEQNFPPLNAQLFKQSRASNQPDGVIKENEFIVKIRDNRLGVTIVIYKPINE